MSNLRLPKWIVPTAIAVTAAFFVAIPSSAAQEQPLYLDPTVPTSDRVEDLLSRMTLEEKIGQMAMVNWANLSSDSDISTYHLGALMSTSGAVSQQQNTPENWADRHDHFQDIALSDRLGIPIVFGVDAVHGHSNLYGATIFPHNIGLGATRDPQLVETIGRITAVETAATGFRWTFSPCLCVARNERWGRTYESFGEHPEIASAMTSIITGYQGRSLSDSDSVLATAKHWVGDGGTTGGVDQGDTQLTESELREIHVPPYVDAISRGVGSIMISYNSWNGEKLHGHRSLITDLLKEELGFTGIVLSDYAGIDQLPGDYASAVRTSINAGIDMVMMPRDYVQFTSTLKNEVDAGTVPMSRIDDAVRRILTKKFEMGLFETPYADRTNAALIGSQQHRAVAQEAVRKSLVLLKNDDNILPLSKDLSKVFVAGKNADDIGHQSGGWTIEWEGASGNITPGTTILEGIRNTVDPGTEVTYSKRGNGAQGHDVAIVVVGETPYAEWLGDRPNYLGLDSEDLDTLDRVRRSGVPMVVVLVSGRPMIVTEELVDWNAFVATWLPGTEGQGVADVLFGDYNFAGTLPFSWPRWEAQIPINIGDSGYDPLFPYGFGLTYPTGPEDTAPTIDLVPAFPQLQPGTLGEAIYLAPVPGSNPEQVVVVEKSGRIHILDNDPEAQQAETFLNIANKVNASGDGGLLSVAFHPEFANDPSKNFVYAYYSSNQEQLVVSRFAVNNGSADASSETVILSFPNQAHDHNGGWLGFGPDGYLYLSTGDDKQPASAQDDNSLNGKIVRIDVENHTHEIWAKGLRNPWRCSFDSDPAAGHLWCGDVGERDREEINIIRPGLNYGWPCKEGTLDYDTSADCGPEAELEPPIWEYEVHPVRGCWLDNHRVDCSIIGGYVYRGSEIPALYGTYVYGDWGSGRIWGLRYDFEAGSVTAQAELHRTTLRPVSFGQDASGSLYVLAFDSAGVYRIVVGDDDPPVPPPVPVTSLPLSINAGGASFIDSQESEWSADQPYGDDRAWGYLGGTGTSHDVEVTGPGDDAMWTSERWGLQAYRVNLEDGEYDVRLLFAETFQGITGPGQRVFQVTVAGEPLGEIDVYGEVGFAAPLVREAANVSATDGVLEISFTQIVEQPIIKGIQVARQGELPPPPGIEPNPPVADAGPDQTVSDGDNVGFVTVTLDASGSYDPDGVIVSYEWKQGDIILGTSAVMEATFSVEGSPHTVSLTVTDDNGLIGTDEVVITVLPNQPPVADAGPDQTVVDPTGDGAASVTLDGTGSWDVDGTIVSYEWSWDGDALATGPQPTVTLPLGTHTIVLTVMDNGGASASDSVTITVNKAPATPMMSVKEIFYWTEGGRNQDQHLLVRVSVVDGDDNPVSGASIGLRLNHNGSLYRSVNSSTGTDGTVTSRFNNAPAGCYTQELDAFHPSFTWDGASPAATPSDPFCK